MDIIWITCLLCASVELTLALPTDGQQSLPLLDHLQSVVNRIQQPKPVVSPGVNRIKKMQVDVPVEDPTLYQARLKSWDAQWDPVPETPGLTNVCETFCPKFCRKQSPNSQNNVRRDCHFACTNLCDKKVGIAVIIFIVSRVASSKLFFSVVWFNHWLNTTLPNVYNFITKFKMLYNTVNLRLTFSLTKGQCTQLVSTRRHFKWRRTETRKLESDL